MPRAQGRPWRDAAPAPATRQSGAAPGAPGGLGACGGVCARALGASYCPRSCDTGGAAPRRPFSGPGTAVGVTQAAEFTGRRGAARLPRAQRAERHPTVFGRRRRAERGRRRAEDARRVDVDVDGGDASALTGVYIHTVPHPRTGTPAACSRVKGAESAIRLEVTPRMIPGYYYRL